MLYILRKELEIFIINFDLGVNYMASIFKKLVSFLRQKSNRMIKKQDDRPIVFLEPVTDVDISKIIDLSEQKVLCSNMLSIVQGHELKLKNRFIGAQTVTDFIEANRQIKEDMGEFIGFHFGCISSAMMLVDSALMNLKRFKEGDFDSIDSSARGMFVSMWYNIALVNIELLDTSMQQIENLEADLVHQQMELTGSNEIILKRGTIH